MNNQFMEWFPMIHIRNEAKKKGLSMSDLNSTLALTMMKKRDPMTNLLMVDVGVKKAEAEMKLSTTTAALVKSRIALKQAETALEEAGKNLAPVAHLETDQKELDEYRTFHSRILRDLSSDTPEIGEIIQALAESLLPPNEVQPFKEKILRIETHSEGTYFSNQFEIIEDWLKRK